MTFLENGNIGMGTDTPTFKLDVVGGVQATGIIRGERVQVGTTATLNDATGVGNTLQFANYNPTVFVTGSADSYIYKNSNVFGGLPAQTLIFQTRSDTTGGGFTFVAGGTPAPIVTMLGGGNVGIGTTTPDGKLDVSSVGSLVSTGVWTNPHISLTASSSLTDNDSFVGITYATSDNSAGYGWSMGAVRTTAGSGNLEIRKHSNSVLGTQIATFTADGLTFNGDTAAANALDDYEEGTWTMGIAFGGNAVGATYANNSGTYTKIGRQVTVNGLLTLSSKGSSTGGVNITGLPFQIPSSPSNYSAPSLWLNAVTFLNQFQAYGVTNNTTIELYQITNLGVISVLQDTNFANNSQVIVNFTYFV